MPSSEGTIKSGKLTLETIGAGCALAQLVPPVPDRKAESSGAR